MAASESDSKSRRENAPSVPDQSEELERLRALSNAFAQLNTSLKLDEVLMNTLKTAAELMNAEVGSIALINEENAQLEFVESTDKDFDKLRQLSVPLGQGIAGSVAKTGRSECLADVHEDRRHYAKIDESLGHRTESYLCVPLIAQNKIIGTAQIMNRRDGSPFKPRDIELMEGFAKQAALAINNAKLHRAELEKKAMESELEVCAQIQRKIFPEKSPDIPGYEVLGDSTPCRQVGGDYYSFIERFNGGFDLVIADVSGKGVPASLMVSELHTGFHLLSQMNISLTQLVHTLNEHLRESLILGKFITLFAMRLPPDKQDDEIEYVIAGHPEPFIASEDGELRLVERVGAAVALGIPGTPEAQGGKFAMKKGDVLISYSDGYSEARSPEGELFDDERIGRLLAQCSRRPLREIKQRLNDSVDKFTHNAPAPDDSTLLLVKKVS